MNRNRVTVKKVDGEWQARVYLDGKWDEDKTYFTGGGSAEDKQDAEDTAKHMRQTMGLGTLHSLLGGKALGEIPTGASLFDLKERAQVAAQKAAHHAAAGHKALARSWSAAATRLRSELQSRLKHTSLGELADLGLGTGGKWLIGGTVVAGLGYAGMKWLKSANLNNLLQSDAKRAERIEET